MEDDDEPFELRNSVFTLRMHPQRAFTISPKNSTIAPCAWALGLSFHGSET
jgi:hypothetical protein